MIHAQKKDVPQAAFAQLGSANLIPEKSRKIIDRFLYTGVNQENLAVSAPEARAYESQTTGLTDMLTGLGGKFDKERKTLNDVETEAKHNFELLAQDIKTQIDSATGARTEKSEARARFLQKAADAKGQ